MLIIIRKYPEAQTLVSKQFSDNYKLQQNHIDISGMIKSILKWSFDVPGEVYRYVL
jgi:hypothetical protein